MKINVKYHETCVDSYSSGEPYGDWNESYESGIDHVTELHEGDKEDYESETFLVPDGTETVYVVYINYDTGNSFGRATGKIDVLHACASKESAHELAKTVAQNKDSYTFKFTDDFGREISIYNNGAGYFERINYVEVESFTVAEPSRTRYQVN